MKKNATVKDIKKLLKNVKNNCQEIFNDPNVQKILEELSKE